MTLSCCQKRAVTCLWQRSPAPTRWSSWNSSPACSSTSRPDHCWSPTAGYSRTSKIRVIYEGSFKRIGLVLIVNTKTLDSSDRLTHVNLSLWSLWSSTTVVLKLWTGKTGGIARAEDGMFPTSSIPHIDDMISHGASKLPKLMTTHVCLMCLHKSGRVVANGPPAPIQPEWCVNAVYQGRLISMCGCRGSHWARGCCPMAAGTSPPKPPEKAAVWATEGQDPQGRLSRPRATQGVSRARQTSQRTWWWLQWTRWRMRAHNHKFWHSLPQMVMDDPLFEINFFLLWSKINFCCFCWIFGFQWLSLNHMYKGMPMSPWRAINIIQIESDSPYIFKIA